MLHDPWFWVSGFTGVWSVSLFIHGVGLYRRIEALQTVIMEYYLDRSRRVLDFEAYRRLEDREV